MYSNPFQAVSVELPKATLKVFDDQ